MQFSVLALFLAGAQGYVLGVPRAAQLRSAAPVMVSEEEMAKNVFRFGAGGGDGVKGVGRTVGFEGGAESLVHVPSRKIESAPALTGVVEPTAAVKAPEPELTLEPEPEPADEDMEEAAVA